jgi:two-component system, OmpR family, heavy metal sensor histidine kinase CusS
MNRKSIRFRMALWYTAVLALGLFVFSTTVWISLRHLLRANLRNELIGQCRGLAQYMQIEDQDLTPHLAHEIDEYSRSMPHDHLLMVYGPDGQLFYGNQPLPLAGPLRNSRSLQEPMPLPWKGRRYLGLRSEIPLKEGTYTAYLAISAEGGEQTSRLLGTLLAILMPLFVAGGAVGGYWLSRRAFQPVDQITERARAIGVKNLSERLVVPQTRDELQRLAETWNDMLARLETAVSRISQFTADASHELRTPVAIMRLAAENALRRSRTEEEYRHTLQQIRRESESMTALLENLLFLARADVETRSTPKEIVDMAHIAEEACVQLAPLASAKNIQLAHDIPSQPVPVVGDRSALKRMLIILLDNAIKYTPEGGAVSVRLQRNQNEAFLFVDDTGIGIPEQARSRIFERFFRVDPSRSRESGGFGLGLPIARTIAQQHSASVELVSDRSSGCSFRISLPIAA